MRSSMLSRADVEKVLKLELELEPQPQPFSHPLVLATFLAGPR